MEEFFSGNRGLLSLSAAQAGQVIIKIIIE